MSASTPIQKQPSQAMVIAAFAALYIIWGSTYTAILIAIREIPPLLMAGIRFTVAGLLLYLYLRIIKRESTPGAGTIGKISVGGFLMLFIGTGSVAWVEQYISSGLAAIIVASTPLWFVLLDKREWKNNFSNKWVLMGLLIGFAGILTLFSDKDAFSFKGNEMKLISFFVLLTGTISWAVGSLYSKYKPITTSTGMKAAVQMMAAGCFAIIASAASGEFDKVSLQHITYASVLAIGYLVVMGSLVGYMAYIWLLNVRSATLVGTYAYVNPVVALFLGWLIAGEQINAQQITALTVILGGVILIALAKSKKNK
ncbi:MAG: EamA family transporter [Chitinophagaceae bacterium]|nr:EamA family transporter [Chitinophagaceae bacterium]